MPLPLAAAAALQLAPVLLGGLFHRKKKGPNRNAILQRYRDSKPVGYTTAEDKAAAESTRTRLAGAAQGAAQNQRIQNARQVTARGLGGPAAAALENNAGAISAAGAEEAARTSASQLYAAFNSNLGYARNQNDTAFGAEMGLASQEAAQNSAQDATFWNSMLEAIPAVASGFSGGGRATTAPTASVGAPTATGQTTTYGATTTGAPGARRPPTQPVYR